MGCGASKKQEENVAETKKEPVAETTLCPKSWDEVSEDTTATTIDLKDISADQMKLLYPKATNLKLGPQVKKLIAAPLPEGMTHIGSDFLEDSEVTTLDLSKLNNAKNLGRNFLKGCTKLKSVTINAPILNTIGIHFLQDCSMLTTLDFSAPAPNVLKIDKNFGENLSSLEKIDLAGWKSVVEIESNFLSRADSLTTIDLSPLVSLQKIGSEFMTECKKLSKIFVKNLTAVAVMEKKFLFLGKQEDGVAVNREILVESTPNTSSVLIEAIREVSGVKIQEVEESSDGDAEASAAPVAGRTETSGSAADEKKTENADESDVKKTEEEQPATAEPEQTSDQKKEEQQEDEQQKNRNNNKSSSEEDSGATNAAQDDEPESPVGIFKTITSSRDLKGIGPQAKSS